LAVRSAILATAWLLVSLCYKLQMNKIPWYFIQCLFPYFCVYRRKQTVYFSL